MTEHRMTEHPAFRRDNIKHAVPVTIPARQVNHERQLRARLGKYGASQRLLLVGSEFGRYTDLADQPNLHAGVPDAERRLAHDLVRDVVDRHVA